MLGGKKDCSKGIFQCVTDVHDFVQGMKEDSVDIKDYSESLKEFSSHVATENIRTSLPRVGPGCVTLLDSLFVCGYLMSGDASLDINLACRIGFGVETVLRIFEDIEVFYTVKDIPKDNSCLGLLRTHGDYVVSLHKSFVEQETPQKLFEVVGHIMDEISTNAKSVGREDWYDDFQVFVKNTEDKLTSYFVK